MDSNISLIKALATTLLTEIDSLNVGEELLTANASFDLNEKVREFEVKLIKTALIKTKGNQFQAAKMLGVKYTTLHNKIRALKISYLKDVNAAD